MPKSEVFSNYTYNSTTLQHLNLIFTSEIAFNHIYHPSKFYFDIFNFDVVVALCRIRSAAGIRGTGSQLSLPFL
jgi:hypothetical protein